MSDYTVTLTNLVGGPADGETMNLPDTVTYLEKSYKIDYDKGGSIRKFAGYRRTSNTSMKFEGWK